MFSFPQYSQTASAWFRVDSGADDFNYIVSYYAEPSSSFEFSVYEALGTQIRISVAGSYVSHMMPTRDRWIHIVFSKQGTDSVGTLCGTSCVSTHPALPTVSPWCVATDSYYIAIDGVVVFQDFLYTFWVGDVLQSPGCLTVAGLGGATDCSMTFPSPGIAVGEVALFSGFIDEFMVREQRRGRERRAANAHRVTLPAGGVDVVRLYSRQ